MSTLKVNKLRDTAGSTDAITLDPNGGAVLAGVTTISTARITTGITTSIQVGGGVTISESGIEASGIGITCASINGGQIGGRRNLIINGAMMVAQRGTSATTNGYSTVDRFKTVHSGIDEGPTYAQVDVSSGTTPYTSGFRKALKITNGNQTSGAGAADYISYAYRIEAQDIVNSGWNYVSSSSFVTLSFWIKSSVAQDFKGYIRAHDGTSQAYAFATGSLSADTWTKITKTISGNSNLTFDNNNDVGFEIVLGGFWGTDYTNNSVTEDAWAAYASGTRMKDNTSTWYTTNDATVEITGLQLEVGAQATPFEHRSFGEERSLCQRYYYVHLDSGNNGKSFMNSNQYNSGASYGHLQFACTMRTNPTLEIASGTNYYGAFGNSSAQYINDLSTVSTSPNGAELGASISFTSGHSIWWRTNNASSKIAFTAEL